MVNFSQVIRETFCH